MEILPVRDCSNGSGYNGRYWEILAAGVYSNGGGYWQIGQGLLYSGILAVRVCSNDGSYGEP